MTNDTSKLAEVTTFRGARFRLLMAAVEATPDAEFDMAWVSKRNDCGTVGCAWGHYVMSNPEQVGGIEWKSGFDGPGVRCEYISYPFNRNEFGMNTMFSDAAEHFGISKNDSFYLFDGAEYRDPTRQAVLARLREFYAERAPSQVATLLASVAGMFPIADKPRPDVVAAMKAKYADGPPAVDSPAYAVATDRLLDSALAKVAATGTGATARDAQRGLSVLALAERRGARAAT